MDRVSQPFRPHRGRWTLRPVWLLALATAGSAAATLLPRLLPTAHDSPVLAASMARAEATMRTASAHLRRAKEEAGLPALPGVPASERGLVGAELTPLVTTLGSLEAKRLAASPHWASAMTRRLAHAGVGPDDVVAASLSGSFPGLNLALAAACSSLDARLVAVSSVTASTWGATEPGFTWPEMEARLVRAGLLPRTSVAISAGGQDDVAADLEPEAQELARGIAARVASELEVPCLCPSTLDDAITLRLETYRRHAGGGRIVLYVNSGGNHASLGDDTAVLRLQSGFLPPFVYGPAAEGGVMVRFAARGVPILHLLNIRDLALRWGVRAGCGEPVREMGRSALSPTGS